MPDSLVTLTVAELRGKLADLPPDMPVFYADPNFGGKLDTYFPSHITFQISEVPPMVLIHFPCVESAK